jgi:hypothetical protein
VTIDRAALAPIINGLDRADEAEQLLRQALEAAPGGALGHLE